MSAAGEMVTLSAKEAVRVAGFAIEGHIRAVERQRLVRNEAWLDGSRAALYTGQLLGFALSSLVDSSYHWWALAALLVSLAAVIVTEWSHRSANNLLRSHDEFWGKK